MSNSRRPRLKICGITRLEDARFCAAAGADLLGFIQHRDSPRYINPDQVAEIVEWVYGPQTVGVFVNESPSVVNEVVQQCGLSYAQLHGDETPEYCREIEVPVIKAFHVRPDTTEGDLASAVGAFVGAATYALLDTHANDVRGGSGRVFDWNLLHDIKLDLPFFLAGGISRSNVSDAIETVRPFGVDVSSSLESTPGIKDIDLLTEFFEAFDEATTR